MADEKVTIRLEGQDAGAKGLVGALRKQIDDVTASGKKAMPGSVKQRRGLALSAPV